MYIYVHTHRIIKNILTCYQKLSLHEEITALLYYVFSTFIFFSLSFTGILLIEKEENSVFNECTLNESWRRTPHGSGYWLQRPSHNGFPRPLDLVITISVF